jgi:hypothetical protein
MMRHAQPNLLSIQTLHDCIDMPTNHDRLNDGAASLVTSFEFVIEPPSVSLELWRKVGDDGVRKAA